QSVQMGLWETPANRHGFWWRAALANRQCLSQRKGTVVNCEREESVTRACPIERTFWRRWCARPFRRAAARRVSHLRRLTPLDIIGSNIIQQVTERARMSPLIEPVVPESIEEIRLAPRLASLRGKRVGFVDNSKLNADRFLAQVAAELVSSHGALMGPTIRKL